MASGTEWRSPLSILMGARRNDDIDLELREDEDYFRLRSFPEAVAAAAAAEEITAQDMEPSPSRSPAPTSSGITSYIPFRYFGLKSPAPPSSLNTPLPPPRGAFPPVISESSVDLHERLIDGSDEAEFPDERVLHLQEDDRQFITRNNSNFNHSSSHNSEGAYRTNRPSFQPGFANDTINDHCTKTTGVAWTDQRAILQTTFNFTNSIIGTCIMGLGGAFAASCGGVSILMLVGFALLTKASLDLVVDLSCCSSVMERTRSQERRHGGHSLETDSPILSVCIEKQSDESDEEASDSMNMLSENNEVEDTRDSPDNLMKTVDSSPLMAEEEHQDNKYEIRDAFLTPARFYSEAVKHRSLSSLGRFNGDYNSLTGDHNNLSKPEVPTFERNNTFRRPCGYEDVGFAAFGSVGRFSVLISKLLYAFGCLVAYVVVVRDNFGLALRGILGGPSLTSSNNDGRGWLYDDNYIAFWVSAIIMLPISCPRTMKNLAGVSFASILSISFLMMTIAYMFFTCTNPAGRQDRSFHENWIEVRSFSDVVQSLGFFAFAFVGHHTVNPAYESLPPSLRNPKTWRRISTNSMIFAVEASLGVGVFAYLTFGSQTPADVVSYLVWCSGIRQSKYRTHAPVFSKLSGYPADLALAHIARLLLCLTMALTFPLPFLTCREMCIVMCVDAHNFYHMHLSRYQVKCSILKSSAAMWKYVTCNGSNRRRIVRLHRELNNSFSRQNWMYDLGTDDEIGDAVNDNSAKVVTEPLLSEDEHETNNTPSIGGRKGKVIDPSPLSSRSGDPTSSESTISSNVIPDPSWILTNGDGKQLTNLWHAVVTFTLWFIVTTNAINGPPLTDVLTITGAFTGTMIAFILPAVLSFKLEGYNHLSMAILGIGGAAGMIGTIHSLVKSGRG